MPKVELWGGALDGEQIDIRDLPDQIERPVMPVPTVDPNTGEPHHPMVRYQRLHQKRRGVHLYVMIREGESDEA